LPLCVLHSLRGTRQCRNVCNCPPEADVEMAPDALLPVILDPCRFPGFRAGNRLPGRPFDRDVDALSLDGYGQVGDLPWWRQTEQLAAVLGKGSVDGHRCDSGPMKQAPAMIRRPFLSHKNPGRTKLFTSKTTGVLYEDI
jgi:hypothetical protein